MPLINPMTQDHQDRINRVLRSLNDIDETIKACQECGLTMDDEAALNQAHREFAEKVKKVFMRESP
jgi:recombinational DNA repair protein RecR